MIEGFVEWYIPLGMLTAGIISFFIRVDNGDYRTLDAVPRPTGWLRFIYDILDRGPK